MEKPDQLQLQLARLESLRVKLEMDCASELKADLLERIDMAVTEGKLTDFIPATLYEFETLLKEVKEIVHALQEYSGTVPIPESIKQQKRLAKKEAMFTQTLGCWPGQTPPPDAIDPVTLELDLSAYRKPTTLLPL